MGSLVASVSRWARTWWLAVPEPRSFSIGWGLAYLMLGASGVSALFAAACYPGGMSYALAAAVAVGVLNIVGMLVAMVSGYRDFWWGERLGISLMLCAAAIYAVLLPGIDSVTPWYICFALVVLGLRWLMIRRFTFRPRG